MDRLVGSKTIQRLKTRTLPAGLRDVQEWTGVTVTFRRRGAEGWADMLTAPVISIRMEGNQGADSIQETTRRGTAKVWADAVADTPLQPQDRFSWNGHVCVIDVVQPVRLDTYVAIDFTLLEGN